MSAEDQALDVGRIRYLLNPEGLRDKCVTVVGLGSGGAPACDHLTMNGVRQWELYDPDTLDASNLIKHPRRRAGVGQPKVELQQEWILDRNPDARVRAYREDVLTSENFAASVARSDLVLSCPDKSGVREFVSDRCVEAGKPFVAASVFRTGIGGEVFCYVPGLTGCYRCLQIFALTNDINLSDKDLGLTDEERERVYGLGEREFRASGLSVDILTISLIQVRMALSVLAPESGAGPSPLKSNWIIFGNRPAAGIFSRHFEARQLSLKPQVGCNCGA